MADASRSILQEMIVMSCRSEGSAFQIGGFRYPFRLSVKPRDQASNSFVVRMATSSISLSASLLRSNNAVGHKTMECHIDAYAWIVLSNREHKTFLTLLPINIWKVQSLACVTTRPIVGAQPRHGICHNFATTQERLPKLAAVNAYLYWSGRRDSNSRPHAPQACALPGCATSRQKSF